LGGDARARAREIDLLRFQVGEIDAAGIVDVDEERELELTEDVLAGAVEHRERAGAAVAALVDDGGAADAIGTALAQIAGRSPFAELASRLHAASAEIADIAAELRATAEAIDEDPRRLAEVRERRQLLRDVRRKYGDTLADVVEFHRDAAARLSELESYEARAATLERDLAAGRAEVDAAAREVGDARRAGSVALARAVEASVRQLAMPHARIAVAVGEPGDDPAGDEVTFMLAANPGTPLAPLDRVASGGELARCMLALRLVLTEDPSTLIFDEVDAGVGGAAAVAIGRALAEIATRHQVLVVTHLPQVAAWSSTHVVVSKEVHRGTTTAHARLVQGGDRVDEVARMLAGDAASRSAREHALELIEKLGTAR
jgi:DNA repair protein RecN (Recombination protein N)